MHQFEPTHEIVTHLQSNDESDTWHSSVQQHRDAEGDKRHIPCIKPMLFSAPGRSLSEVSPSLTVALSGSKSASKSNPENEKDRARACFVAVDANMGPSVSSRFRRDFVEALDDE